MQSLYLYFKNTTNDGTAQVITQALTDPAFDESRFITRIEAVQRCTVVHNLDYKIALSLLRGGQNFHG